MKKRFFLDVFVPMVLAFLSVSCAGRHTEAIDAMVEELNSPEFRAMEAATGLFDDSKAEIDGDRLVVTFVCRPFIDLSQITPDQLPMLAQSATAEFRNNLSDPKFRQGIEALAKEDMTMLLVWKDSKGGTINIPVDPHEVLSDR